MKRRIFLKNSALFTASSFFLPAMSFKNCVNGVSAYSPLNSYQLTDFDDEQYENPILIQNKTHTYLTTLRRKEYPADTEIISLFEWENENDTWVEREPVTQIEGHYEAITADCDKDGYPAVAWTEITNNQWMIKASLQKDGLFQEPFLISNPEKRSINPVIKAFSNDRFIIAWESYEEGMFSIYMSKYSEGSWSEPMRVTDKSLNCFHPAIEYDGSDKIYIAYDVSDGVHRNIEMRVIDKNDQMNIVPVAIGGPFKDRVNINVKPALSFDKNNRLWISWENNRFAHRLQDGDNYTGDRCCAMVSYQNGDIVKLKDQDRWLFKGKNDHWPNFQKDRNGNLYLVTHCGGDFTGNPFWKFRISHLDPSKGWSEPLTLLETRQKGESIIPTLAFDKQSESFWLAWKSEQFVNRDVDPTEQDRNRINRSRRGMLELNQFSAPVLNQHADTIDFEEAVVEENHPVKDYSPKISGRPRSKRPTIEHKGTTYTLLIGNLHEHSEISSCWPAGTDGTLHDDYRFGITSEGYDFMGITDHAYSHNEVYWRKHLRLADFYNDEPHFVALPSVEWTLSNRGEYQIRRGAGHRNIIFATTDDAKNYIRNKDEIFSVNNPETDDAPNLWKFLHDHNIDCVSIPHHPADETHACCWETRDEVLEPLVEIFQCRGNAEYRGAPRMINVARHVPTENDKGFIDYALKEKKHKLGFIASGDHNSIGVGLACIWVKQINRGHLLNAMKNRRVFATTGDQISMDVRLNGVLQGQSLSTDSPPKLTFTLKAADNIKQVDILRNSQVIDVIEPTEKSHNLSGEFEDLEYQLEDEILYYYLRIIQQNGEIGWSSPIWVENSNGF